MAELHDLTALELGELVRRGDVTPLELTDHFLERADRLDSVGAFVTLTPDLARDRATELTADQVLAEPDSPLWGVPTAIKDLNATAGVRTTFGSAAFADFVPEVSDGVTLSIEAAGMVSLGKTNTPEFGSPCYTEPDVAPPAVTPWDRTRTAGGSSGGAAAAVAAGLVPVAQGSDGGGSIRIPASCCGLVGLKPTRGRISGHPMYGDPVGLGTAGSIARTVRDAAAMLDVLAGRRVGDPSWAPPPSETFLSSCDRDPGRLRVARFIEPVITDTSRRPRVRDRLGGRLPAAGVARPRGRRHRGADAARGGPDVRDLLGGADRAVRRAAREGAAAAAADPVARREGPRGVSGPEFGLAIGAMRRYAAEALTALAPYDAVLTPTLATPPLPVGAMRNDADPAADFDAQKAFTPWTSAWNVTGMPAVSLPLHWTPDGLPVGVMIAARPAEEQLLLALSAQIEAAAPWADRRPPGW